ncbi:pyridoxal-phosphate dependent enzyme [Nesterenkonia sp. PF2B19]|uniref:pyridoxal-phosphate dependent enzyme n=1 Tax=Nesterenkonia sp. PF2B19 TaxID=1881858 RepID=UPI00191C8D46|nr:pyridoxal-phosphate dependent enzyme [Nesterenkonia sp. PF2B19]
MNRAPRLLDVVTAHRRLRGRVRTTAVEASGPLSAESGAEVLIKWENQQVTGSFKARGALNTVDSLSEAERARGVVTASSGNHAQGLSWAAAAQGCRPRSCAGDHSGDQEGGGADARGGADRPRLLL